MTYLQIVNNVLKRLRERTVSSVDENTYSTLIGILVNDAKREVEDSWDWSALRTTLSATTSNGVFNYELNGSGNRATILDVINDTSDIVMGYKTASWMNKAFLTTDPSRAEPSFYSFNGISADGDTLVDLYPIPNGAYDIRFNCILRTEDFEMDADSTDVPSQAIMLLAYAKAVEERGEDGGVSSVSAYAAAQRALSDAISFDGAKHPEELIWNEV
jgi:hypothetical protein